MTVIDCKLLRPLSLVISPLLWLLRRLKKFGIYPLKMLLAEYDGKPPGMPLSNRGRGVEDNMAPESVIKEDSHSGWRVPCWDIYHDIHKKTRHCSAVIKQSMLHASETLNLNKKSDIENLKKKERKIVRKILGPRRIETDTHYKKMLINM